MSEFVAFWVIRRESRRFVKATRLYQVWVSMRSRCLNPNHHAYRRYGGRGISICTAWEIFGEFRSWAISSGYEKGLSIDRIDNDGDYSPENCRWATDAMQMRNRSINKLNAELARQIRIATGSSTEIARMFGISRRHVGQIKSGRNWA